MPDESTERLDDIARRCAGYVMACAGPITILQRDTVELIVRAAILEDRCAGMRAALAEMDRREVAI